mmetsp:Transcript_29777/g.64443  ORF Transcript_29777/g.64443 Transcript_29777/m.64443 type:complete len:206 (-) Transcript_29777:200-817(-)|eukprot:CAMPEP_0206428142 /NCGR_PEP_ID=MMETSP0324_2-20121206/5472_1 /ASSEMBLY_ACC=CAM_ASM_000836 /TAXON_ID=2866 /ORGANISM="Crypthecodinium cohnii, Strain Seligo" /LENGTH=205 /DNA_ID=CAMNT_0053893581 /DNA_START=104 /DNA_END=721 /DNA_ORIENTATION=-
MGQGQSIKPALSPDELSARLVSLHQEEDPLAPHYAMRQQLRSRHPLDVPSPLGRSSEGSTAEEDSRTPDADASSDEDPGQNLYPSKFGSSDGDPVEGLRPQKFGTSLSSARCNDQRGPVGNSSLPPLPVRRMNRGVPSFVSDPSVGVSVRRRAQATLDAIPFPRCYCAEVTYDKQFGEVTDDMFQINSSAYDEVLEVVSVWQQDD